MLKRSEVYLKNINAGTCRAAREFVPRVSNVKTRPSFGFSLYIPSTSSPINGGDPGDEVVYTF